MEKAILAGGCFWCIEAVFQILEGVEDIIPVYTGGNIKNPSYKEVCTGRTGHAEAVEITFNNNIISFNTLLEVFFVVHDPTTLNRQGNDKGTQYRSGVYYTSLEQEKEARTFIESLDKNKVFDSPIVTEIQPFEVFYKAESGHSNYYVQNSQEAYCDFTITPKVEKIKEFYSDKLKM